jgi:hypothetical protein
MENMVEKMGGVEVAKSDTPREYLASIYNSDTDFARKIASEYEAGDEIKVLLIGKVASITESDSDNDGMKTKRVSVNLEFKRGECVDGKAYSEFKKSMGEEY